MELLFDDEKKKKRREKSTRAQHRHSLFGVVLFVMAACTSEMSLAQREKKYIGHCDETFEPISSFFLVRRTDGNENTFFH